MGGVYPETRLGPDSKRRDSRKKKVGRRQVCKSSKGNNAFWEKAKLSLCKSPTEEPVPSFLNEVKEGGGK